jgi:hypothetical protein
MLTSDEAWRILAKLPEVRRARRFLFFRTFKPECD